MEIRSDRGWLKAGLAVLVTGVLGGGVMAVVGGPRGPHRVTADGVTAKPPPAAAADRSSLDLAAGPAADDSEPKPGPEVGDKVMVGSDGGSVTVSAVEDNVSAGRLFGAGQGHKYIAVEVKGCSGPHEKNLSFEPSYFLLRLDDGTVHDPGAGAKKPSLDGGTMPAGKCLSGWVTYTVRDGSVATAVIYDGSSRLTWAVPPPKNYKPTTTTTGRAGAAAEAEADEPTTTTAKPKTTATTARSGAGTATTTSTARSHASTPTTAGSSKPATTSTTAKSSSTPTTAKSSTTTTAPKGSSTTTTSGSATSGGGKPAASSTTTTTGS